jgi:hypothetical protein
METMPVEELKKAQLQALWLSGRTSLDSEAEAARFLKSVSFALRYNATPSLPLASMYRATGDTRRAIELTNALLAGNEAIETNVIADRLVLVHKNLMPAVYALRSRQRASRLTPNAEQAFELIVRDGHASSGDVRRFLGWAGRQRPDPADVAMTELQRELLVDRGPSSIPRKGIPYLSPEGFPYRPFEKTHPDIVRAAGKLSAEKAVIAIVEAYLEAAVFATPRKLASMFKLLFTETELNSYSGKKIDRTGKHWIWKKAVGGGG